MLDLHATLHHQNLTQGILKYTNFVSTKQLWAALMLKHNSMQIKGVRYIVVHAINLIIMQPECMTEPPESVALHLTLCKKLSFATVLEQTSALQAVRMLHVQQWTHSTRSA